MGREYFIISNKIMRLTDEEIYQKQSGGRRFVRIFNATRFLTSAANSFICSIGICIVGFIFLLPAHCDAQDHRLPIFQVDESRYEMRNYDEAGELQFYQVFDTGLVSENDDMYHLPIEMYSYNEKGELQDSTKAIYYSQPGDKVLVFFVYPFTDYSEGTEIKVDLKETSAIYPAEPDTGWQMSPVEFKMFIDTGLTSFLGGESEVRISNRHIAVNDTLNSGEYQVNSRIDLQLSLLDVKVTEFYYNVTEIVDRKKGVIRQEFRADDGSYFIVRRI